LRLSLLGKLADDPPAFELPPAEAPAGCAKATPVMAVRMIKAPKIFRIMKLQFGTARSNHPNRASFLIVCAWDFSQATTPSRDRRK
jgi:hypothetical protein